MSLSSIFNRFRGTNSELPVSKLPVVDTTKAPSQEEGARIETVQKALEPVIFNSKNDPTGVLEAGSIEDRQYSRGLEIRKEIKERLNNYLRDFRILQAKGVGEDQIALVMIINKLYSELEQTNTELGQAEEDEQRKQYKEERLKEFIAAGDARDKLQKEAERKQREVDLLDFKDEIKWQKEAGYKKLVEFLEASEKAETQDEREILSIKYFEGLSLEAAKKALFDRRDNKAREDFASQQSEALSHLNNQRRDEIITTATKDLLKNKKAEYTLEDYYKVLNSANSVEQQKLRSAFGFLQAAAEAVTVNGADEITGQGAAYLKTAKECFRNFDTILRSVAQKQGVMFAEKTKDEEPQTDAERIQSAISERLILKTDGGKEINLLTSFETIAKAIAAKNPDAQYLLPSMRSDLKRMLPSLAKDAIIDFPHDSSHRDGFDQACENFTMKVARLASGSRVNIETLF
jgi:hypothetical protein